MIIYRLLIQEENWREFSKEYFFLSEKKAKSQETKRVIEAFHSHMNTDSLDYQLCTEYGYSDLEWEGVRFTGMIDIVTVEE